jgi:hypothetical protein
MKRETKVKMIHDTEILLPGNFNLGIIEDNNVCETIKFYNYVELIRILISKQVILSSGYENLSLRYFLASLLLNKQFNKRFNISFYGRIYSNRLR